MCLVAVTHLDVHAQAKVDESEYYRLTTIPIPDSVVLEAGGLAFTDDDRLAVCTRRGEVWLITDPYMRKTKTPAFTKFASGLHEALGLASWKGNLYTTQRAEITKLTDTNGDDRADLYESVYSWPLSGNYHEYSYGPLFLPNGDMLVTLNLAWIGYGESLAKWRGWMLKISQDGQMTPIATGLRSPAGFGFNTEGDVFYAENQGDWIGSGRITHLEKGDFAGNPAGLKWSGEPESPLGLKKEDIPDSVGLMYEFAKNVSSLKIPTVWFPHTIMGISTSFILADTTGGKFGPFTGQLFVGDQGHSKVMRVFLEKVKGEYQGACFPFREGFESGVLRPAWGKDGSLFVGMTSRGWNSTGPAPYGLQKLTWTGKMPFEIKSIQAKSNGFELEFTMPVNAAQAGNLANYNITGFTYSYHRSYGSPIINQADCHIHKATVSDDRRKVRPYVGGLREGYVHELKVNGIKAGNGTPLLHNSAYYTLNNLPEGEGSDDRQMPVASANDAAQNAQQCGPDPAKHPATMPASWANGPDIVISIGTEPGLKYDVKNFEVEAGSKVQLTFGNNDDMLHNLVMVKPNTADQVGELALKLGIDGPKVGYIPASDNILFHTCLLQPESVESIYFVAPAPGTYTYVCTFPGHAAVMRGTMTVVAGKTVSGK